MQKILEIAFRGGWATVGSNKIPSSISTACPHCEEKVVFTLGQHRDDSTRRAVAATGRCPGCSKDVQFWAVRSDSAKGEAGSSADVFMYPPAKSYPHREFGIDVPEGLRRSMRSTIDALNTKNHAITAVSARRTLEGIFKYLVPEEKRHLPLAKLIDQATSEVDLAAPLTALSQQSVMAVISAHTSTWTLNLTLCWPAKWSNSWTI